MFLSVASHFSLNEVSSQIHRSTFNIQTHLCKFVCIRRDSAIFGVGGTEVQVSRAVCFRAWPGSINYAARIR